MKAIVKRVVCLLFIIFATTIYEQGRMLKEVNPEISEEYLIALDDFSLSTKENEETLRKLAYEIEVQADELDDIRSNLNEHKSFYFTSYENMRLAHFYSVIMNRYEPSDTYRDTALLIEYVYDGLLKREQLKSMPYLSENTFFLLIDSITFLDTSKQEAALQRIVDDFLLYANEDVKQSFFEKEHASILHEIELKYLNTLQQFIYTLNESF